MASNPYMKPRSILTPEQLYPLVVRYDEALKLIDSNFEHVHNAATRVVKGPHGRSEVIDNGGILIAPVDLVKGLDGDVYSRDELGDVLIVQTGIHMILFGLNRAYDAVHFGKNIIAYRVTQKSLAQPNLPFPYDMLLPTPNEGFIPDSFESRLMEEPIAYLTGNITDKGQIKTPELLKIKQFFPNREELVLENEQGHRTLEQILPLLDVKRK